MKQNTALLRHGHDKNGRELMTAAACYLQNISRVLRKRFIRKYIYILFSDIFSTNNYKKNYANRGNKMNHVF